MKITMQNIGQEVSSETGFFSLGPAAAPLYEHEFATSPTKNVRRVNLPRSTDLSPVRGSNVLFFLDDDKFRISMRKSHGLHINERLLRQKIEAEARSLRPGAAYCATARDSRGRFFERDGWEVVAVPQELVCTFSGAVLKANIDMYLCVEVGLRATSPAGLPQTDCTLIGSGDGDLCVAIARTLKRRFPEQRVITVSVPGSTSHRLTSMSGLFDGHIEVGLDMALEMQTRWSLKNAA